VFSAEQEADLLQQALAGDVEAFGQLVLTYQQPIFNLTYRMLGDPNEAEDAAQEAFIRAYSNLTQYDVHRSFKTWLFSIASNHCIDRLRKRRLTWLSIDEPLPPHPSLVSSEPGPEQSYVEQEKSEFIQDLLKELSPDYRAAVILRYWYDMSYAEIADALKTTESAIKSRLFRARQSLAEKLENLGIRTSHNPLLAL
jgi:RNA polymerase sigma-70 factor (ECF subfamily)